MSHYAIYTIVQYYPECNQSLTRGYTNFGAAQRKKKKQTADIVVRYDE